MDPENKAPSSGFITVSDCIMLLALCLLVNA